MELELASPNEKEKQMMKMRQYQAQAGPLAQQKPGMAEQMGDKVKNEAMNEGMNMGKEAAQPYMQSIKNAINPMGSAGAGAVAGQAATNAALASTPATMGMGGAQLGALASTGAGAGAGAAGAAGAGAGMAALGTAVPYIGAAMLADQALGLGIMDSLFSDGGKVGPLAQYKAEGGGTMSQDLKKIRQMPLTEEMLKELEKQGYGGYPTTYEDIVGPVYKAEGGGTMSREEAMALMNNPPAPMEIPMPQSRPINFPDPEELLREMSMPQARPQLQDYSGADRTFSPYDMIRPDNAPNT
jgi:hypothetical protein